MRVPIGEPDSTEPGFVGCVTVMLPWLATLMLLAIGIIDRLMPSDGQSMILWLLPLAAASLMVLVGGLMSVGSLFSQERRTRYLGKWGLAGALAFVATFVAFGYL